MKELRQEESFENLKNDCLKIYMNVELMMLDLDVSDLRGDQALFGGFTTKQMKERLGVQDKRPLADFLPTLTIAAKNLATEMTNYNVEEKDLQGETAITVEHVENNTSVRDMLGQRGIKPENLPASEDIKKLERRVKREEKKLAEQSGKLTNE